MDPLSIIASVTGILTAAAKITTVVTGFIQSVGDVPASTRNVLTEVSDLSLCLSQLVPFLQGTRNAERIRGDGISVEQVVVMSTSLVMSISELEKLLDSFKLDLPMPASARIQWVRNEEKINRNLDRIRTVRSSLNLILTIFTCLRTQKPTDSTTRSRSNIPSFKGLAPLVTAALLGFRDGVQVKHSVKPQLKDRPTAEGRRSARIDQMLHSEKNEMELRSNVLMLGACLSGKSTVLKQMRLAYSEGFSLEERKETTNIILSNILIAIHITFEIMEDMGQRFTSEDTSYHVKVLRNIDSYDITHKTEYLPKFFSAIKAIYADPEFQGAIKRGNEYVLHDNFRYYMAHIDRVFSPNYLPNDEDVLHSRIRTEGIMETFFETGKANFTVFDVDGVRSGRKQWVHVFENIHSLLFVASLSGYDECLIEDTTANQMQEALMLFEAILSLTWFKKSAITLLLTKVDLFEQKIKEKPIRDYFPDYTGRSDDSAAGLRYFVGRFLSCDKSGDRRIQVFCTDVTDTRRFNPILQTIIDTAIETQRNVEF